MSPVVSIRRIMVALDASVHSEAALEAAAALAAALEAELVGVYVEDSDLIGIAGLPFAEEVDALSGECRPLLCRQLEDQLRALAERSRKTLRGAAQGRKVRWSFRSVRGRPNALLAELAAEADLLALGMRGRSPGREPGSTARALLAHPGTRILVTRRGQPRRGGVYVVDDGSPEAAEAIRLAAELSRSADGPVVAMLLPPPEGDDSEAFRARRDEVGQILADGGVAGSRAEVRAWPAAPMPMSSSGSSSGSAPVFSCSVARSSAPPDWTLPSSPPGVPDPSWSWVEDPLDIRWTASCPSPGSRQDPQRLLAPRRVGAPSFLRLFQRHDSLGPTPP